MKTNWYMIKPFGPGFLGICKAGEFWGKDKIDLINILIEKTWKK